MGWGCVRGRWCRLGRQQTRQSAAAAWPLGPASCGHVAGAARHPAPWLPNPPVALLARPPAQVGNSGMFRPEMLRPMGLPEGVNVIAWGLGLERCVVKGGRGAAEGCAARLACCTLSLHAAGAAGCRPCAAPGCWLLRRAPAAAHRCPPLLSSTCVPSFHLRRCLLLSARRPTMILYGIDNIRDLFGHKVSLSMVKRNPICRLGL